MTLEGKKAVSAARIGRIKADELRAACDPVPIPEKEAVMSYFRSVKWTGIASGHLIDMLTGEDSGLENAMYIDDKFFWYSDEMYYFDKYNFRLTPEFVEHAVKRMEEKR